MGIQLSQAPLIAFLDGDDEWLPNKLERQITLFANPKIGVVYSRRKLIDGEGNDLATPKMAPARGQLYDTFLVQNPVCFSSVVVRRSVFESVGVFDPNLQLAIDYDLWLRASRHFEFDYVDEPLVRYRTGHANLSSRIVERLQTVLAILRRSLLRRRNRELAEPKTIGQAWGSTCRTMGFVLREKEPIASATWYGRAVHYDGRWVATAKAVIGNLIRRGM